MDRPALIHSEEDRQKQTFHRIDILFGLPEETFLLREGVSIIGRSPDASIQLRQLSVFPEHCKVILGSLECWVEDCGGGTIVNGTRIRARRELLSGDVLQLGSVSLRYRTGFDVPGAIAQEAGRAERSLMSVDGLERDEIPLKKGSITLGRGPECAVVLNSAEVMPHHASITVTDSGALIIAGKDHGECRVNGLHFDEHELGYGDRIQLGPYLFQHTGKSLRLVGTETGAALNALDLSVVVSGRKILDHVSLSISQNKLVGIIGPIGAGKSTFLKALNGLQPATLGKVLLNGADLYENFSTLGRDFGWVPQEVIVHRELSVRQALTFSARLRLPARTPEAEIRRAVMRTAQRLSIERHMEVKIRSLSGGETKTVSVAIELLSKPHVLVLDEPTSGLDPAAEFKMMELLRQLADAGCTVVCSTHNMQNVYLFDQLAMLSDGMLVFTGKPQEAREFFGSKDVSGAFLRLKERPSAEWREIYESHQAVSKPGEARGSFPTAPRKEKKAAQLPLLLERQWAILIADARNLLILLGQPLLIGFLLAWAVSGTSDDSSLKLFLTYIATLWFGCSNGAQSLVGELNIYRRERMVGLRRGSYLFSKAAFIGFLTIVQALLLYLVTRFCSNGVDGSIAWQATGLGVTAVVSTCLGLAISASSRSTMQAVLLVPLIIIPQIVLSGYTVPASSMRRDVSLVASAMPTYQIQRIMDTSLLWDREIDAKLLEKHMPPFRNMNAIRHLGIGERFFNDNPARLALMIEALWIVGAYLLSLLVLRAKERD
jgi:ABC-type multidrug transport system ATPase subunit/pSer/pThr/pTyr-binding forkhead associated (FHA) protein